MEAQKQQSPAGPIPWGHIAQQFRANVDRDDLVKFARELSVEPDALEMLGIGYDPSKKAWTFPFRDDQGEVTGIQYRAEKTGKKFQLEGSTPGLFYPPDPTWGGIPSTVDLVCSPEGATDAAALMSIMLFPIARPQATGTRASIAWMQSAVKGKKLVIFGENDRGVGIRSAVELAMRFIAYAEVWIMYPPQAYKDLREWIKAEGELVARQVEHWVASTPPLNEKRESLVSGDVLLDTQYREIARVFVEETQRHYGICKLRSWLGVWWHWRDGKYRPNDKHGIELMLREWLQGKKILKDVPKQIEPEEVPYPINNHSVNNILADLATLPDVYMPVTSTLPMWLDKRPTPEPQNIIALQDGLFDVAHYIRTGRAKITEPTPAWFSSWTLPYRYDPEASPNWFLSAMDRIFEGDADSISLWQEWLGYQIVPDNRFEKLMMLVGRPGCGKGTMLTAMEALLGSDNIASSSFTDIGSEFGLESLVGKLAAVMGDAHIGHNSDGMRALERLKMITGNDPVHINQKGVKAMNARLVSRFTITVNELPDLPDRAAAMRRRTLLLFFARSFEDDPARDDNLKAKLMHEGPGIFNWALQGLRRLRTTSKWTAPTSGTAVAKIWQRMMAPVLNFIQEQCTVEQTGEVTKEEIYRRYVSWCKADGFGDHALPINKFGQQLLAVVPGVQAAKGSPTLYQGARPPVYRGIRLNNQLVGGSQ